MPADCVDAYRVCDVTQPFYFEAMGTGMVDDANGQLGMACLNQSSATMFESHSAFFKFTPQYSGQFGFYITPDIEEDWEWILFGPNPDCSDLPNAAFVACNTSSPGNSPMAITGMGDHPSGGGGGTYSAFNVYTNLNAGDTYVLFVVPFVTTSRTATITWQGAAVTAHPDLFTHPDCTASSTDTALQDTIEVFPNPASSILYVRSPTATLDRIIVYTVNGTPVYTGSASNDLVLDQLATGIYILKVYDIDGNLAVKRIVVQ